MLNVKQTFKKQDKNTKNRKLIFWYDVNGDFTEDVDTLELKNAKVYHLCQDNQFYTKYFLEYEDTVNNYLIYAPFAKPGVKDNHLEDMLLYSKRFYADRASLIALDLKIDEKYKYVLVPVYVGHYKYKNKLYNFYINGENGRITGKTPVSKLKVFWTVMLVLAIIAGIVALSYFFGD